MVRLLEKYIKNIILCISLLKLTKNKISYVFQRYRNLIINDQDTASLDSQQNQRRYWFLLTKKKWCNWNFIFITRGRRKGLQTGHISDRTPLAEASSLSKTTGRQLFRTNTQLSVTFQRDCSENKKGKIILKKANVGEGLLQTVDRRC